MERARDEELITKLQEGDKEALEMLFSRYKKPIFNYAFRLLGNRADAEDSTGEAFLTLYTKCTAYKPTGKFSTWLFTITRNICITKIRKRKKIIPFWFQKEDSKEYEQWEPTDDNLPSDKVIKSETAQHVRQAVRQLPDEQREALLLREYHQTTYQEIADVMNCSMEKVKILIYRAREALRQHLPSILMEDNNDGT